MPHRPPIDDRPSPFPAAQRLTWATRYLAPVAMVLGVSFALTSVLPDATPQQVARESVRLDAASVSGIRFLSQFRSDKLRSAVEVVCRTNGCDAGDVVSMLRVEAAAMPPEGLQRALHGAELAAMEASLALDEATGADDARARRHAHAEAIAASEIADLYRAALLGQVR